MNTKETLETLIQVLEAPKVAAQGHCIPITNHMDIATQYLTEKSLSDLNKKVSSLFTHHCESEGLTAIYLGVTVRTDNIEGGIKNICDGINILSRKNLIYHTHQDPSSIRLGTKPNEVPSSTIACIVLIPTDQVERVKTLLGNIVVNEGVYPPVIDDLELVRPEGQFSLTINVSLLLSESNTIEDTIKQCLAILPLGTEVVSIVECSISILSLPYVVTFFNPLMKDFKEIRLNHTRHATVVNDKLEQFSLFTGIEYIKR